MFLRPKLEQKSATLWSEFLVNLHKQTLTVEYFCVLQIVIMQGWLNEESVHKNHRNMTNRLSKIVYNSES